MMTDDAISKVTRARSDYTRLVAEHGALDARAIAAEAERKRLERAINDLTTQISEARQRLTQAEEGALTSAPTSSNVTSV